MDYERFYSAHGHVCVGGGAEINNSPINITINLNISSETAELVDDAGRPTELGKVVSLLKGLIRGGDDRSAVDGPSNSIAGRSNRIVLREE